MASSEQRPFVDHRLEDFLDLVAAREPAPGGGAAAAVTLSLAAGLVAMAARFSSIDGADRMAADADQLRRRGAELADNDSRAYAALLLAQRTTRTSAAPARREALRTALDQAARVPLEIAELGAETAVKAARLVQDGNPRLRGDAATAALLAEAAVRSAGGLVEINVRSGGCDDDLVRRAARQIELAAGAVNDVLAVLGRPDQARSVEPRHLPAG